MNYVCDRYAISSELFVELSRSGFRTVEVPMMAKYPEKKRGTGILSGFTILMNLLLKKVRLKR